MSSADPLREHVLDLVRRTVERRFDQAIADFPLDRINEQAPQVDYSFWALVEHLRIGQWDIVEYVLNPSHVSPPHPEGYWPKPGQRGDAHAWNKSVEAFRADSWRFAARIADPATDLLAAIPHTPGHTVLREV